MAADMLSVLHSGSLHCQKEHSFSEIAGAVSQGLLRCWTLILERCVSAALSLDLRISGAASRL